MTCSVDPIIRLIRSLHLLVWWVDPLLMSSDNQPTYAIRKQALFLLIQSHNVEPHWFCISVQQKPKQTLGTKCDNSLQTYTLPLYRFSILA